jgi:hypothetical protein
MRESFVNLFIGKVSIKEFYFVTKKTRGLTVGKFKEKSPEENKCFQNFYRLEKRQGAP